MAGILAAQAVDWTGQQYATKFEYPDTTISVNNNGVLVRRSAINDAVQSFFPLSLQAQLFPLMYRSKLARHPRTAPNVRLTETGVLLSQHDQRSTHNRGPVATVCPVTSHDKASAALVYFPTEGRTVTYRPAHLRLFYLKT